MKILKQYEVRGLFTLMTTCVTAILAFCYNESVTLFDVLGIFTFLFVGIEVAGYFYPRQECNYEKCYHYYFDKKSNKYELGGVDFKPKEDSLITFDMCFKDYRTIIYYGLIVIVAYVSLSMKYNSLIELGVIPPVNGIKECWSVVDSVEITIAELFKFFAGILALMELIDLYLEEWEFPYKKIEDNEVARIIAGMVVSLISVVLFLIFYTV